VIPAAYVTEWATRAPWPTRTQVEQDLLLSRLIIEIADDDYLGNELVFRGGTCLHKLHVNPARRYSEDLDYVRATSGGIAELTGALSRLGESLDFEVSTRIGVHPKVYFKTRSAEGVPLRIKIEVNTRERSPAEPLIHIPYQVSSPWWSGNALVQTFTLRELVATKIRALFERNKGRDLFDMWLALTELGITGDDLLEVFGPYHSPSITAKSAIANLEAKLRSSSFRHDLDGFITTATHGYDIDEAGELISRSVLQFITSPLAR